MTQEKLQADCDRIIREAIAEPDQKKQLALLLSWIIDAGKTGDLVIVPPLDEMLGIVK
jgi:hypothetical protein